ncbi:hypothetical protein SAMN04488550_0147 [Gordonia malaquae]|uniref:Uncharacterized protein n=2 Tax=Gordonia TaxID=2053 RepID=M3UN89_GORML|nr:hypothetical protein [Gordonia malaquae]GAC81540.1 hypothetical protein GM1_037_00110 [Gordonia malaquae NBRC 108250]GEE00620.1 hypothetical protein nbrc107696_10660 [Gordonia spumicola]SEB49125.1 hypothetical protein SAMN04488550_0147 [Gordonia malaquae]
MTLWAKNRFVLPSLVVVVLVAVVTASLGDNEFPVPRIIGVSQVPVTAALFIPALIAIVAAASLSRANLSADRRAVRRISRYDAGLVLLLLSVYAIVTIVLSGGPVPAAILGVRIAVGLTGLMLLCRTVMSSEMAVVPPVVYLLMAVVFGTSRSLWAWIADEHDSRVSVVIAACVLAAGLAAESIRSVTPVAN